MTLAFKVALIRDPKNVNSSASNSEHIAERNSTKNPHSFNFTLQSLLLGLLQVLPEVMRFLSTAKIDKQTCKRKLASLLIGGACWDRKQVTKTGYLVHKLSCTQLSHFNLYLHLPSNFFAMSSLNFDWTFPRTSSTVHSIFIIDSLSTLSIGSWCNTCFILFWEI